MFSEPPVEKAFPTTAVAIATVAVVILVGFLFLMGRRDGQAVNAVQPLAAYAPSLAFTDEKMLEATSFSGGKSIYVEGIVTNHGPKTVTGVMVQVLFRNDTGMAPEVETVPLALIRTREPAVDTQPVSADPLGPGAQREFRLVFENINQNWNQTLPEIRPITVGTK